MSQLIEKLARRLPRKDIGGECFTQRGPLLVRYALLKTRWFSVYLHHFLRSDADRHFHDHPWAFASMILTGSYIEHTPAGARRCRRFTARFRPANWLHWVEVSEPMWTLIVVSRKTREWGFSTEKGWIPWERYASVFPEKCD